MDQATIGGAKELDGYPPSTPLGEVRDRGRRFLDGRRRRG
jgi:hypothetical protein